ncbi:MAG: DegT/DnrJ/EryC1/StrS family aminotransferase [Candidatus Bathyarchaeia archaeon]
MRKKIKLIEPVIGEEEIKNVSEVLRSGWLTEGQQTKRFEEMVRNFIGVRYAIATTSCTTALELALRALDIGPGDEVIVPSFTHPATGNVVKWIGAKPVLVDVDLSSYNIDLGEVEKAITRKTKCVIPVSWAGNPLDAGPLNELKEKYNLFIVEDAACSLGAECDGKKTGTMADITCFSFHPRKIITTGEGGMVVTNNSVYAERIKSMKEFGMDPKGGEAKFVRCGTNYKLSDVLAAIGVEQMKKIEVIINRRIELANYYNKLLAEVDLIRPPQKRKGAKHVYQTYAVYIEKEGARDEIIVNLRKKNIETQIGTYALHLQPSYKGVKKIGKLERAEKLYRNLLALPMCHSMTREDQEYIISELQSSLKH